MDSTDSTSSFRHQPGQSSTEGRTDVATFAHEDEFDQIKEIQATQKMEDCAEDPWTVSDLSEKVKSSPSGASFVRMTRTGNLMNQGYAESAGTRIK